MAFTGKFCSLPKAKSFFKEATNCGLMSNRTFQETVKPSLKNEGYMTNECICIEKNGDLIRDKKVLVELFNESYKKNCRNIIWQGAIIFWKFWRYCTGYYQWIKLYQNTVLIPVSKKLEGNFLQIKNLNFPMQMIRTKNQIIKSLNVDKAKGYC